jgi:hypothetical protein
MSGIDPAEFEALRREVGQLRDRQEILDRINTYCRGLDRLDPDLVRAAFHPDAIDNHYDFVGGVDDFVPYAIEVESRLNGTHHGISTHLCEIDGDTAHAESYVHFFLRRADGKTASCGAGRYIDRLERRDGQWRVVVRQILMDAHFEVDGSAWIRNAHLFHTGSRDRGDPSYHRPFNLPPELLAKASEGDDAVRNWAPPTDEAGA